MLLMQLFLINPMQAFVTAVFGYWLPLARPEVATMLVPTIVLFATTTAVIG